MQKLIYPYSRKFTEIFDREKNKISKQIEGVEIHHIGSTSVPGLGGKGMIDVMIGIKNWNELSSIIENLKKLGFKHIHPRENGRVFLSKVGQTKLGDVHIHIVIKNGKQYKQLLLFRDYLRAHRKEIAKFFNLKKKWAEEAEGDRQIYGKLKRVYVKSVLRGKKY